MSNYISVEHCLPQLIVFLRQIAKDYHNGKFSGWKDFRTICFSFYTKEMMNNIEAFVPGWQKMASYADGQTLIHVTSVLALLLLEEEYLAASPQQQVLLEWIVMFHDIEKEVKNGKRDHTHGFRSAAAAAKALPGLGFTITTQYKAQIEAWLTTTCGAEVYDDAIQSMVQDNTQLPEIVEGIDQLFMDEACLIIKGVLFHMSLNVVEQWPALAPLIDDEIKSYITPELLPFMKTMMLVDNAAWAFFEPARKVSQKQQTLDEFQRIADLIST